MISIDLKGKTALVTGATGQLGRCISQKLAACGADVILCYNQNDVKALELEEKIKKEYDVKVKRISANIRSLDSVLKMRDEIEKSFKLPDIIVNCAVSQYNLTTILNQPVEDYTDQFETTVIHNVAMIKAFVPHLIEQNYGRVIGINTECAMKCESANSAYVAGKRGMDGIYRVLAKEVGEYGITVNQVAPGWTYSDYERENGDADENRVYANIVPLRRRGTDHDIANAVAFLASDLASFITGVYLPVNGGNTMPAI